MKKSNRIVIYTIGIFLFALGIAFAIKSNLGVSPVSSLPYVASVLTKFSVGTMTASLYIVFVFIQWVLLGSEFEKKSLLQLVFALAFGFCVDFSRLLIESLGVYNMGVQILYLIIGTSMIGFGIFLILKSGLIVSPTDGLVKAIAHKLDVEFSRVKIGVDLGTAGIAAVLSFVFLGKFVGVGVGTLISAFGVGMSISLYDKCLGGLFTCREILEVNND